MKNISGKKKRLLFIAPTPPPVAGPEVSTQILLNSPLKDDFELIHLRSNVHLTNAQRGEITLGTLYRFSCLLCRMVFVILTRRPSCVYTILNQNVSGFLRDSLVVLLAKLFGVKVVLHFRGSNFEYFYKNQSKGFQAYVRFVLKRVDAVILQANWVKERFKQFVPSERLHVIFNAVPQFILEGNKESIVNRNGGQVNVLFLNHLSVAKGFLHFLEASKAIVATRKDIVFTVVGDKIPNEKNIFHGENGQQIIFQDVGRAIEEIKRNEEFNGRIRFLGEINDDRQKLTILQNTDIFVLPSYSEGCPMSVLEAMAVGLPVVVTPVGALKEIIRDPENGLFAPIGDSRALKEKIEWLADYPHERGKIGQNNRVKMGRDFSVDIVAKKLAQVFNAF